MDEELEIMLPSCLRRLLLLLRTIIEFSKGGVAVSPQAVALVTQAAAELEPLVGRVERYFQDLRTSRHERRVACMKATARRRFRPPRRRRQ